MLAGVRCTDGIIICADTEVTYSDAKFQEEKIWGASDYLLLTGAGATSYMKMAFDKLAEKLSKARPKDQSSARLLVERLVSRIYAEHIFPFSVAGHHVAGQLDIWLIVAIRCENGELALIKTSETSAILVNGFDAVGTGQTIFKYWAGYLFQQAFTMDLASYFAMFMLREAKHYYFSWRLDSRIQNGERHDCA